MACAAGGRLRLRRSSLPLGFRRWEVALWPGCERPYVRAEWAGSIVLVERGQVELVWLAGGQSSFKRGAILFFTGLPLRVIRNRASEPALLVAVSRLEWAPPSSC